MLDWKLWIESGEFEGCLAGVEANSPRGHRINNMAGFSKKSSAKPALRKANLKKSNVDLSYMNQSRLE